MAKKSTRKQTGRKTATRKTTGARNTTPSRKAPARKATGARKTTATRKTAGRKSPGRTAVRKTPRSNAAVAVRGRLASAAATIGAKMPWASGEPDAIEILEKDHRRLEDLLKQGDETTERGRTTRRGILDTIGAELTAHELMEEKVLYPALKAHPQARDIVLEGYEEHHVADLIIEELRKVATDDEQWGAKFKVLKENIEHHIEEEEGEMFRTARGIFSQEELQELAARMLALRRPGKARTAARR